MNIREITDGILYAGVNDRVTDRFEALWPLPYGVSYNSYIVRGTEKTALIDTVEIGTLPDYLGQVRLVNPWRSVAIKARAGLWLGRLISGPVYRMAIMLINCWVICYVPV